MIGFNFWNRSFLELGTRGSTVGKHWFECLGNSSSSNCGDNFCGAPSVARAGKKDSFQRLGTARSSNWEPVVPRLGSIDSSVWEPAVPRAGNPWFQDWEALLTTFAGHHQLLEPGTRGSKIGKDWFQRLGTSTSGNPWFQDWEALVTTLAGHHQLLEPGTCGSKIGKDWFQRLGTSTSGNPWFQDWEALVTTLAGHHQLLEPGTCGSKIVGRIGLNVWEPAPPRTGNPWFQDWEALSRTFGSQQFLELGARGSNIGADWLQRLGTSSS